MAPYTCSACSRTAAHKTPELASALNPERDFAKLAIEVAAMGYPVAGSGQS